MDVRLYTLLKLEVERKKAKSKFHEPQQIIKRWFDKHLASNKDYVVGDLVLQWDKSHEEKVRQSKFKHIWIWSFSNIFKTWSFNLRLASIRRPG